MPEKRVLSGRILSGVAGLDNLLGGGFEIGSSVLLSGDCGTGKTVFALQFANTGASNGEPTLYVSFEESAEDVRRDFESIGIDIRKLEEKGLVRLLLLNPLIPKASERLIEENVNAIKAKRVVIDSLTAFCVRFEKPQDVRGAVFELVSKLKGLGVTSLLTSQAGNLDDGVSDFIADCVINVAYESFGTNFVRTISIRKMRRSGHSPDVHPITIDKNGMRIG